MSDALFLQRKRPQYEPFKSAHCIFVSFFFCLDPGQTHDQMNVEPYLGIQLSVDWG